MKVIIEGTVAEVAALTNVLQGQQGTEPAFVPETADGLCRGTEKVATGASC